MIEQELPEHFELAKGVVSCSGRLRAFHTFDTDTHVSSSDHVHVVGTVTNGFTPARTTIPAATATIAAPAVSNAVADASQPAAAAVANPATVANSATAATRSPFFESAWAASTAAWFGIHGSDDRTKLVPRSDGTCSLDSADSKRSRIVLVRTKTKTAVGCICLKRPMLDCMIFSNVISKLTGFATVKNSTMVTAALFFCAYF